VYPNPANSWLFIRVPAGFVGKPFDWQLRDVLGRILLQGAGSGDFSADLSGIQPGTYTLSLQAGSSRLTTSVSVTP
jgi:hypothetical protein